MSSNIKKSILQHMIYNRHKKYTALNILFWAEKEYGHPIILEEVVKILHKLTELGFLKEFREKKGSKVPPRYQAEPGHVRKLIEMIDI